MAPPRTGQQTHKSGPLKQKNKIHKTGRHRSKGALDLEQKGRVPSLSSIASSKKGLSRIARRNKISQVRQLRKDAVLSQKRSLGSSISPPFLTTVINLTDSAVNLPSLFGGCNDAVTVSVSPTGIVHVNVQRLKQRFSFVYPDSNNLLTCLDSLKVADSVLLIWPADGVLSVVKNSLLACCFAHGLPTAIHVVQNTSQSGKKKKEDSRKQLSKVLEQWSLDSKCFSMETEADLLLLLRQIGSVKRKRMSLQETRAHLVAEDISVVPIESATDLVTLKVFGYVRGPSLSVNGLIHVPGIGDFQMSSIDSHPDAYPLSNRKEMEEVRVLETADPAQQEPLQAEVVPDLMSMEQVLSDTDGNSVTLISDGKLKKVRRVPKGTSDYQACWIVESETNKEEEVGEEQEVQSSNESDAEMNELSEGSEDENSGSEGTSSDQEENDDEIDDGDMVDCEQNGSEAKDNRYDEKVAADDAELVTKFRKERENEMFPDEIDTPLDIPARIRFQKYRGLKSFRTSPIDPKENLPFDYSRIFQFENFRLSRKRALSEQNGGALAGFYVCIRVANFPANMVDIVSKRLPLVVYGMLRHEQKFTTVNLVIKKVADYTEPITSKEKLIFHVGYRRFQASPIYSQHTNGDKHKYERFMPSSGPVVATVFAPIIYPPATVLVFKRNSDGTAQLVATGSVLDVNPNRIVMKRVVLSGHPFKINRKSAVVRYMFFNREDVLWFKPIELVSKYGRKGHIKEPLGTHGHMKCVFDGQLNSQDSVLMKLYKRIYPKWTYENDSDSYSIGANKEETEENEMETG